MASSIWAWKSGVESASLFTPDDPGRDAAYAYCAGNGDVLFGPGTEALADGSIPAGVRVTRWTAAGKRSIIGDTFFRGRPWHDVRAWGAKGDGSTDDTTAIQNAINAAETDGTYLVVFPQGTYKVTNGGLMCKRETTLLGMGMPTITMTSTTATLATWATPTTSALEGGGARNIAFDGAGGTSIGLSIGDPAHPAYYAGRILIDHCNVTGFGTNIVLDGFDSAGSLSLGYSSATEGFALKYSIVKDAVSYGLLNRCNWGVEICLIEHTYFWNNGQGDAAGAGLAHASTGPSGVNRPSAQCSWGLVSVTFNGNGQDNNAGTSAQILIPSNAGCYLHATLCSFESVSPGSSCHIRALSDGQSASYNMPKAEVVIEDSYLQGQGNTTYKDESIVIASGQLQVIGTRISQWHTSANITVASCSNTASTPTYTTSGNFLTSKVKPGMLVSGTGVPAGTYVKTVNSATSITISQNGTGASGVTLTFVPLCAQIKAGISGGFCGVSLYGNHYQAFTAGSSPNSNARILNLIAGTQPHTHFVSHGGIYEGFWATDPGINGYVGALMNPIGVFGAGDLYAGVTADYAVGRGASFDAHRFSWRGQFDPFLACGVDVSGIQTYNRVLKIHSSPDVTGSLASVLIPVVATANLEAAGASANGKIVIEDNGTGDRNLIIYGGGQRFRIDGGAAF